MMFLVRALGFEKIERAKALLVLSVSKLILLLVFFSLSNGDVQLWKDL